MKELPYKKIYFVGIKGVGMASLAVIAKQAGYTVGGSDVPDTFISDKMLEDHEIVVHTKFDTELLEEFTGEDTQKTLIIVTAAHGGLANPQAEWARNKGIDTLSFGQALGMFQFGTLLNRQDIHGLSVAGSHGKTTTSAMLATVLKSIEEDPSYLIGTSEVGVLGDAGYLGEGKYFVVESDEYFSDLKYDRVPKFHYQHPFGAIITNIDFDHPDVFENIEKVYDAFKKFVGNIQSGGVLSLLGDNTEYRSVLSEIQSDVRVVTFGLQESNIYQAGEIQHTSQGVSYTVKFQGEKLGQISLPVIGTHNAINSLSVFALLHTLGIPYEKISQGLSEFTGTKRRMDIKGFTQKGALVIDDYAHHPAEVRATLTALKSSYPDKKIVCIFQPHTLSRTEKLIDNFSEAFYDTDTLLLMPIFASAREGQVDSEKQKTLYDKILAKANGKIIDTKQNMVEYCTQNYTSDEYIIVTMGAGDVYKVGEELINNS